MDENLLDDVVKAALAAGADAAEAVLAERQSLSVNVRNQKLEEVEREEARDLGLRVFVGQQQASVSGSDLSADARARLIERVVAMARLAPPDPYAGLAPADRLAREPDRDLDLFDATEPTAEALEDQARARRGGRPRRRGRDQQRRRLGRLGRLALAVRDQRRLLRPSSGVGLLAVGLGHRRRRLGHGDRRRGAQHPLGRRPAHRRKASATTPVAARSSGSARASSTRGSGRWPWRTGWRPRCSVR